MVPLQSIACETPVIATRASGMLEYLSEDNAILLSTSGSVSGIRAGNQSGHYFAINEDHLIKLLQHVCEHWEDEYAKVQAAAPLIRQRFSWPVVLAPLVDVVKRAL